MLFIPFMLKQFFILLIIATVTTVIVYGKYHNSADDYQQQPKPRLVFKTSIRIAEAFSESPGATGGDGCIAAEAYLKSGNIAISKVAFDGVKGRLRQNNANLEKKPTQNITNIGRWDLKKPQEWDLTTVNSNDTICKTELLPPVMCPNGTLPPSCPPTFGSWGGLNMFTSILGMWYPNTTKLKATPTYDVYQYVDVKETLIPNEGCGTSSCNMKNCGKCIDRTGNVCTKCPCENCIVNVNVTRNYTYTVSNKQEKDGSHQLIRYYWTQGIPLTKSGASPGIGRDCFLFDWSQNWSPDVDDNDFAPPKGLTCD